MPEVAWASGKVIEQSRKLRFPSGKDVAERQIGRISLLEITPSAGAVSHSHAQATAPFLPHWRTQ